MVELLSTVRTQFVLRLIDTFCAFTRLVALSQIAHMENFHLHECSLIVLIFALQEYFSNGFHFFPLNFGALAYTNQID